MIVVESNIPPKETQSEIRKAVLILRLSSKMYFFCKKKLITIPTKEEITFMTSLGNNVTCDNTQKSPMSAKVATPDEAANLDFMTSNFFMSSLLIKHCNLGVQN